MAQQQPNVILVITDDQGYGDLACHGNPVIQTPHLDQMRSESVRLDNFHVGPTCAPTRAGLMTGRYCNSAGVWHTIAGRSLLRSDETTIADCFQAAGYKTGMFGKWHLGDNYPFRPHDRGFQETVYHGGGGVGQTPDYWGNDYFDDTYFNRGEPVKQEGYCTDVWFDLALQFIEKNRQDPFLCYLSTNAPHGPFRVPDSYSRPYREHVPQTRANFYGMITNIDENFGRLRRELRRMEIDQDTILIFMTDNGTAAGCRLDRDGYLVDGFNAGMRGQKGSEYEGGHRVPFFLRWPNGGLNEGRSVNRLTANIDALPTLADLCGVSLPDHLPDHLHGQSVKPLLYGEEENWSERILVTDSQRVETPIKWRKSAVMTDRWRLINGKELYDIQADPEQRNDIADAHPDAAERLRNAYESWWETVSERFDDDPAVVIGTENEPLADLTTHDWHNERSACAWNQGMVRNGVRCNGYWRIEASKAGRYRFELRRWPMEEDRAVAEGIPGEAISWYTGGKALPICSARIRVGGEEQSAEVAQTDKGAAFEFDLPAGPADLQTWLIDSEGESLGAYYVYAQLLDDGGGS